MSGAAPSLSRSADVLRVIAAGEFGEGGVALVLQVVVDADSRRVVAVDRRAFEQDEEAFERRLRRFFVARHAGDDLFLLRLGQLAKTLAEGPSRSRIDRFEPVPPAVLLSLAAIRGQHVLIIEDIVDTGHTLSTVLGLFRFRGAKSVRLCALLDKHEAREVPVSVDYSGFKIDNVFVVGYGLDLDERYRELPYIGVYDDD